MGQKASCRRMTEGDLAFVTALDREAFFDPWTEATWRHELTSPIASWYVVLGEDGTRQGYAGLWCVAG